MVRMRSDCITLDSPTVDDNNALNGLVGGTERPRRAVIVSLVT